VPATTLAGTSVLLQVSGGDAVNGFHRGHSTEFQLQNPHWNNSATRNLWSSGPTGVEFIRIVFHRKEPHMAKAATKSEILKSIAQSTELSRKKVAMVFDALYGLIQKNVGKKGPGVFVVPKLLKIGVVHKPALPARKGINPFTKQEQVFKAKSARKVIKVRPLKLLKDFVYLKRRNTTRSRQDSRSTRNWMP
jgi:nucleoid DNA-binding protein